MTPRPVDAFVALVTTVASVVGLTILTATASWVAPALWCALVATLAGIGLRRVTSRRLLVLLGQLVVGGWFFLLVVARDAMVLGVVPGPATLQQLAALGTDLAGVLQRYAAPIPVTPGVVLLFAGSVLLLAILVDFLAVTCSAPAAAGVPLLAAFLTAVANSGAALAPGYFLVAGVAWLYLVGRQATTSVRGWSTTVATPRDPVPAGEFDVGAVGAFSSTARRLGGVALVLAVVLPALLPHLPTRFILDGLGHSNTAVGRGTRVGYSSTLDLTKSLQDGSLNPVLRYTTSAPGTPPPLRVAVATQYDAGQWQATQAPDDGSHNGESARAISPDVAVNDRQVSVTDNLLEPPRVAAFHPVVSADFGSTPWSIDADTDDLGVAARSTSYSFTYREVDVLGSQLRDGVSGGGTGEADPLVAASRSLDPGSADVVSTLAERVTQGSTNAYTAAVAIQNYLRGSDFTYSLTLKPSARDAAGRVITDPVVNFLTTKQGYCVQFATAMVMMARARGIPARMAIGFLPGTFENGAYTVRSADAHAWPELYFPGAGWLRFEPTPSGRTGSAPAYTVLTNDGPAPTGRSRDPEATATNSGAAIVPTGQRPGDDLTTAAGPGVSLGSQVGAWFSTPWHLVLVAVFLGLLGSLVLPLTARLVYRRRRARAVDAPDLVEAQWDELVSRLGDLGLHPPSGGTLRDWRRHYTAQGYLDDEADASIQVVVGTLERARYARSLGPDRGSLDVSREIGAVTSAAAQSRPRRQRLRAFFLPAAGTMWWRRRTRAVLDGPRSLGTAVADRLASLRPRRRR